MQVFTPSTAEEVREVIGAAIAGGTKLEIRGGGSKALIGAPREAAILDMRGLSGIVDYDPPELVLTVRPGTPLAEVQALVEAEGQMLAFDPWDHGPLFGEAANATIGGVAAAGVAGPCRVTAGGARDHLLGFEAVSGRGERFVAGGKVVKNVTGYDLPKLLAGSWGRLAAMTELTFKVLPRPRQVVTLAAEGLSPREAQMAMSRALGSQAELSAAAHLPESGEDRGITARGRAITLFRLAGFPASVAARCKLLPELLRGHCALRPLEAEEATRLWDEIRYVKPLAQGTLWRAHVPPSRACDVIEALQPLGARWLLDWGGGLIWLQFDGDAATLRQAAERAGGHAALVRASEALRAHVPAQQPRAPGLMALEARVRRSFDPLGVFETGRFLDAD